MTGMNRPRTALIAAALVCVLASGGCASGHAAQENGTTGGQTAPTSAKSSQEVNAETTSSGIQEETSPSDKEMSAEPVNHVNGSSENGAAEADVTGLSEAAGNRLKRDGLDCIGEADGL